LISLEQVQLLETKIAKAIDYVERLTSENAALSGERTALQKKLDANQKRLDELEVLVMSFKEDQGRIEDGIIAALDRLSQFEEAFENSLKNEEKAAGRKQLTKREKTEPAPPDPARKESREFFEINEAEKPRGEVSGAKMSSSAKTKADTDLDESDLASESELDIF